MLNIKTIHSPAFRDSWIFLLLWLAGLVKEAVIRLTMSLKKKNRTEIKMLFGQSIICTCFSHTAENYKASSPPRWPLKLFQGPRRVSPQMTFILGFQRLLIKAIRVEGLLNNVCFITVMKVIYQTRLPVCTTLSCFIWTVSPLSSCSAPSPQSELTDPTCRCCALNLVGRVMGE